MSQDKKTPAPFCLRLTFEERARLEQEAGKMPLGTYIRSRLFDAPTPRKRKARRVLQDQGLLSQLLAVLGSSNIANNLNQLARGMNRGALIVTEDTETAMQDACKDVRDIRQTLLRALGLSSGGETHDS